MLVLISVAYNIFYFFFNNVLDTHFSSLCAVMTRFFVILRGKMTWGLLPCWLCWLWIYVFIPAAKHSSQCCISHDKQAKNSLVMCAASPQVKMKVIILIELKCIPNDSCWISNQRLNPTRNESSRQRTGQSRVSVNRIYIKYCQVIYEYGCNRY